MDSGARFMMGNLPTSHSLLPERDAMLGAVARRRVVRLWIGYGVLLIGGAGIPHLGENRQGHRSRCRVDLRGRRGGDRSVDDLALSTRVKICGFLRTVVAAPPLSQWAVLGKPPYKNHAL